MEVILKKTKITNSILKQALRSTHTDLSNGKILGWCLFGKFGKKIVCYRDDTHVLSIFPMFKEIECIPIENNSFRLKINLEGHNSPLFYFCVDENSKNDLIETLNKAKHIAQIRGQFFI